MRKRYQDPGKRAIVVEQMSLLSSLSPVFDIIADAKKDGANTYKIGSGLWKRMSLGHGTERR
jgi:hypothetical protein